MVKQHGLFITTIFLLYNSVCSASDGFASVFAKEYASGMAEASFRGGGNDPIVGIFVFGAGALAYATYKHVSSTINKFNYQKSQSRFYQQQADLQLSEDDFEKIEPHGYDLKPVSRSSSSSSLISSNLDRAVISPSAEDKLNILSQLISNNSIAMEVHNKIIKIDSETD